MHQVMLWLEGRAWAGSNGASVVKAPTAIPHARVTHCPRPVAQALHSLATQVRSSWGEGRGNKEGGSREAEWPGVQAAAMITQLDWHWS